MPSVVFLWRNSNLSVSEIKSYFLTPYSGLSLSVAVGIGKSIPGTVDSLREEAMASWGNRGALSFKSRMVMNILMASKYCTGCTATSRGILHTACLGQMISLSKVIAAFKSPVLSLNSNKSRSLD